MSKCRKCGKWMHLDSRDIVFHLVSEHTQDVLIELVNSNDVIIAHLLDEFIENEA